MLDKLVAQLFDRTVNSIKKIKTVDSEEWIIIGNFIVSILYCTNDRRNYSRIDQEAREQTYYKCLCKRTARTNDTKIARPHQESG